MYIFAFPDLTVNCLFRGVCAGAASQSDSSTCCASWDCEAGHSVYHSSHEKEDQYFELSPWFVCESKINDAEEFSAYKLCLLISAVSNSLGYSNYCDSSELAFMQHFHAFDLKYELFSEP